MIEKGLEIGKRWRYFKQKRKTGWTSVSHASPFVTCVCMRKVSDFVCFISTLNMEVDKCVSCAQRPCVFADVLVKT